MLAIGIKAIGCKYSRAKRSGCRKTINIGKYIARRCPMPDRRDHVLAHAKRDDGRVLAEDILGASATGASGGQSARADPIPHGINSFFKP